MYDSETDTTVQVPVDVDNMDTSDLEFFYDDKVRKVWDRLREEWYFSVVDVVTVLTESADPKQYLKRIRQRDPILNSNWGTICTPLRMPSADGKMRKNLAASTEGVLRLIQSIPSKKAEPFKLWLARVGKERLDEMADPEQAVTRGIEYYRRKGYSEAWIERRMHSIDIRKQMTDEWKRSGIEESKDFAILTNILTHAWSGKTVQAYKAYKGLHKENLKDNMTATELVLNELAEISTTELSKVRNPNGMGESKNVAREGGQIAGNARRELEARLGHIVISSTNATTPHLLDQNDLTE